MGRSPELENFNGAAPFLFFKDVPENDDAVGDKLFDSMARDFAVLIGPLGREHGRHLQILQSRSNTEQLVPDPFLVRELSEDGADGVEHHTFRANRSDGMLNAG